MEIFADTFSHEGEGLKSGVDVAPVAYWSAVVMAGVRLGRRFDVHDKIMTSRLSFTVSTVLAAKYITNFGRKTMYFMSTTLTIMFQVAFGIVHYLNIGLYYKSVPIVIICCQVFFLQLGLQTFPNLLSSELFPNDARSSCKGMIRAFSALSSAAMLKMFPYTETQIGK